MFQGNSGQCLLSSCFIERMKNTIRISLNSPLSKSWTWQRYLKQHGGQTVFLISTVSAQSVSLNFKQSLSLKGPLHRYSRQLSSGCNRRNLVIRANWRVLLERWFKILAHPMSDQTDPRVVSEFCRITFGALARSRSWASPTSWRWTLPPGWWTGKKHMLYLIWVLAQSG